MMRYGVFAATQRGRMLALRLKKEIYTPGCQIDIYLNQRLCTKGQEIECLPYEKLALIVPDCMKKYEALIFIMSTGIVVRTIAPYIKNKTTDPAIVVLDEAGKNVISLLSGHLGGGNDLTELIAAKIDSNPVITTATDVNGLVAPDVIGQKLACRPIPKERLVDFNSALLEGDAIKYLLDDSLVNQERYIDVLQKYQQSVQSVSKEEIETLCAGQSQLSQTGYQVLISNRDLNLPPKVLQLKPQKLIAGIGCRKGVSQELISKGLDEACHSIGWSKERVNHLASTTVKSQEQGLLALAQTLDCEISFFDNKQLKRTIEEYSLEESKFVKEQIGVGNICEGAGLSAVAQGKIALGKSKFEKVTVALIWEK